MATKQREIPRPNAKSATIPRAKKSPRVKLSKPAAAPPPLVSTLRKSLGLNRKLFARFVGYSERAVAQWESGAKLSGASLQKMNETRRLHQALATVMKPEFVPQWLQAPQDVFGGLKPLEVVERGEVDRIWRMVYALESGMPG